MKRDITFYHAGIAIEMEHDVPVKISCPVCSHKVEGGFDEAFRAFVPHFDTHTQEERSATDVIGAAYKRREDVYRQPLFGPL